MDALIANLIGRREALAKALRLTAGLCGVCLTGGLLDLLTGCTRAPITGREQLIFFSEETENKMGIDAYRDVLRQFPLSTNPEANAMIRRVGERVAAAANKPSYDWEFALIQDDKIINAFCLPGGKVAFFTGILKHTQNETGVATVMGHEVTHAIQRHGVERISRGIIEQIAQFGAIAGAATGKVDPRAVQGVLMAYGVNASLPFNRAQESEADYIGLRLMAQAGYDPHEAVAFWERMSGCPRNMIGKLCFRSGAGVPEFLSTHPSEETRIKNIERWIPEAMHYYNPPPDAPPAAPPSKAMG
ncbi:MAG: M48 family metallopeptidase [Nitrospirae bacterium]|nr:MAG: M48 family metallopeptidase [Nitrospirota bacterium]